MTQMLGFGDPGSPNSGAAESSWGGGGGGGRYWQRQIQRGSKDLPPPFEL